MDDNDNSVLNIFTDIDTIMDTRLPIVNAISPEVAKRIVANNSYFTRTNNRFEHISNEMFNSLYRDRNKDVLVYATPTPILRTIAEYCIDTYANVRQTGNTNVITVYINIYPYNLNTEEQDLIKRGMLSAVKDVNVKLVSMSNAELTPEWVNENLAILIKYDGLDWLEYHTAMLTAIRTPMMDISLMVPTMTSTYYKMDSMRTEDAIKFFSEIEEGIETIIKLTFVGVNSFCGLIK